MNNTSGKRRKNLEKFLNTSGSREKKNKTISNNSKEKHQYKYEYSNVKKDCQYNIHTIQNDDEGKNILIGLIKEGLISVDEFEFDEKKFDINNLNYKDINLEKILQKLLFLNKSLKNTQNERKKLENEQTNYLNTYNESKISNISHQENNSKGKDPNNNSINNNINDVKVNLRGKGNNGDANKFNEILKKYEDDLKFLEELIVTNNNYDEFK